VRAICSLDDCSSCAARAVSCWGCRAYQIGPRSHSAIHHNPTCQSVTEASSGLCSRTRSAAPIAHTSRPHSRPYISCTKGSCRWLDSLHHTKVRSPQPFARPLPSALPCPVLSCPVLSCPVLSCPVLSCPVLSCPVLPALPCLVWPGSCESPLQRLLADTDTHRHTRTHTARCTCSLLLSRARRHLKLNPNHVLVALSVCPSPSAPPPEHCVDDRLLPVLEPPVQPIFRVAPTAAATWSGVALPRPNAPSRRVLAPPAPAESEPWFDCADTLLPSPSTTCSPATAADSRASSYTDSAAPIGHPVSFATLDGSFPRARLLLRRLDVLSACATPCTNHVEWWLCQRHHGPAWHH
jgi:hypothetical protein